MWKLVKPKTCQKCVCTFLCKYDKVDHCYLLKYKDVCKQENSCTHPKWSSHIRNGLQHFLKYNLYILVKLIGLNWVVQTKWITQAILNRAFKANHHLSKSNSLRHRWPNFLKILWNPYLILPSWESSVNHSKASFGVKEVNSSSLRPSLASLSLIESGNEQMRPLIPLHACK